MSILPTSDALSHVSTDEKKLSQHIFYWGIEKEGTHNIQIGDLVQGPEGVIGQVILLYKHLNRQEKSSRYMAWLRLMIPFPQIQKHHSSKWKRKFRPTNALIETNRLLLVDISQFVQPVQIVLKPSSYYTTHNPDPPVFHDHFRVLHYHCPCRLVEEKPNEDAPTLQACHSDWPPFFSGNSTCAPLERAWNALLSREDSSKGAALPSLQTIRTVRDALNRHGLRSHSVFEMPPAAPLLKRKNDENVNTVVIPPKKKKVPKEQILPQHSSKPRPKNDTGSLFFAPSPDQPTHVMQLNARQLQKKQGSTKYFYTHVNGNSSVIHIGTVVAVHTAESSSLIEIDPRKKKHFPFHVPWSAGQVVSIFTDDSKWYIQVRWLYTVHELEEDVVKNMNQEQRNDFFHHPLSSRMLIERDEHCSDVPIESVVGYVRMTSRLSVSGKELNSFRNSSGQGLPELLMICRYGHNSATDSIYLYPVSDWDEPMLHGGGPLLRGLFCDKTWPGKHQRLSRKYIQYVQEQLYPGLVLDRTNDVENLTTGFVDPDTFSWDEEWFDVPIPRNTTLEAKVLGESFQVNSTSMCCFSSLKLPLHIARCHSRAISKKSNTKRFFPVKVGDIVCISNNEACPIVNDIRENHIRHFKNPWYPFSGKWSYAQILSIYSPNTEATSDVRIEIRHLKRTSELEKALQELLPPPMESLTLTTETVLESDIVEEGVSAGRILGLARVYLGHHKRFCNFIDEGYDIPTPSCLMQYSLVTCRRHIQPIFSPLLTPSEWYRRLVERGVSLSKILNTNDDYRDALSFETDLDVGGNKLSSFSIFNDLIENESEDPAISQEQLFLSKDSQGSLVSYLIAVDLEPLWSVFDHSYFICHESDRRGLRWTVVLGDIVAFHDKDCSERETYPFAVPWKIAQVCLIRRLASGDLSFDLQLFSVLVENDKRYVLERKRAELINVTGRDVLGPVDFVFDDGGRLDGTPRFPFMPFLFFFYRGLKATRNDTYLCQKHGLLLGIWKKGIRNSNCLFSEEEKDLLVVKTKELRSKIDLPDYLASVLSDDEGPSLEFPCDLIPSYISENNIENKSLKPSLNCAEARSRRFTKRPLFSDDCHDYYSTLDVIPPYDEYLTQKDQYGFRERKDPPAWTVSSGDPVILRYQQCVGPANYHTSNDVARGRAFPFRSGWGVAEIVLFRKPKHDDLEPSMEVRWFYRENEVPGSKDIVKHEADMCEEIYESDLYSEESVNSILAPVSLQNKRAKVTVDLEKIGMPVIEFFCDSFWSASMKAMVPCGSQQSRTTRGRLQSNWLARIPQLRQLLQTEFSSISTDTSHVSTSHEPQWLQAFERVMQKLSLTNASHETISDSHAIIGREKERNQIKTFLLRTLSSRKDAAEAHRPILFIAGPPGTGKTACVKATVAETKREKHAQRGDFQFIEINGMELRTPSDIFPVLWEKICGRGTTVKLRKASDQVDSFFKQRKSNPKEASRTFLLLIDEIDYLVSRKMNVLFNLFQLPQAGCNDKMLKNRIVLIGISNTLDLPERIHARTQSRIGENRCMFKSYMDDEIKSILESKIKSASGGYSFFDADALSYASKRVANSSGDIRRALNICKQAGEEKLRNGIDLLTEPPRVRVKDILNVCSISMDSAEARGFSYCSSFQILLLVALSSLRRTSGREFGGFDVEDILTKMKAISSSLGDSRYSPPPSLHETLGMIQELSEMRLVGLDLSQDHDVSSSLSGLFLPLVEPLFSDLEVLIALKKTDHKAIGEEYLSKTVFDK